MKLYKTYGSVFFFSLQHRTAFSQYVVNFINYINFVIKVLYGMSSAEIHLKIDMLFYHFTGISLTYASKEGKTHNVLRRILTNEYHIIRKFGVRLGYELRSRPSSFPRKFFIYLLGIHRLFLSFHYIILEDKLGLRW